MNKKKFTTASDENKFTRTRGREEEGRGEEEGIRQKEKIKN